MKNGMVRALALSSTAALWAGLAIYDARVQPQQAAHDSVAALNGGAVQQSRLRDDESIKNTLELLAGLWTMGALAIVVLSFYPARWRITIPRPAKRAAGVTAIGGLLLTQGGCWRPYDTPEYENVDTAETAFVVPLEGDSGDQSKFQSESFLQEHKVAAKRVQIVHRWNQTGRLPGTGEWIPEVRLIKVNRSPITREWTAEERSGSAAKDQAIWVESADSVGFSIGFTATAHITEENAARFLYWYPAGSLADVMDHEIRGRVQQTAAEVAAKYPLDELRGKKQEIIDSVRKDVTTFFADRGITITTVGMFGGMTYENPKIQQAIDEVFIAQQLKDVALAKFDAQAKTNEQIALEAEGLAKKSQTVATAEANAKVLEAEGEAKSRIAAAEADAKAIQTINAALQNASPQLLALRQMDLEKARIEKWSGVYPTFFMGGESQTPNLMIQMPAGAMMPTAKAK
ncbi:MAG: SPFH domain-containing protein [Tepidisphaeraceae bacterium]